MYWEIYQDDQLINTIVADEQFCKDYCQENGYTYKPAPEKKPEPTPIEQLQKENILLKAQIQAQSDRADFMEGCIAEMEAGKVDRADLDDVWEQMANAYREGVQQA